MAAAPTARPKRPVPANSPKKVQPARADRPFLRFHHSPELRTRTLAVLDAVEESPGDSARRDALGAVAVELTNAGLDDYLMRPLRDADPGFVTVQSANLGMATAQQVLGTIVRNVIGRMDAAALLSVCASIRQMMR